MRLFRSLIPLFVCASAWSAFTQPLADRLPASTLIYSGWSPNASLQTTKAATMLADARIVQPWQKVIHRLMLSLPDVPGGPGEGDPRLSEHLSRLLSDASQCEGCFALLELKPHKGELLPQAVLLLNLGARRGSFEEHFKPIQAKLKERLGERLRMMKLEGPPAAAASSWLWMKTDRERPEYTWGFIGDWFVFYFGDGAERFLPTLSAPKVAKPLKESPAFVDCLSKIPGESVLTTYVDVPEGLRLIHTLIKDENDDGLRLISHNWARILAELGLDNIRALGEKTIVQDGHFVTRTLLRTSGGGTPHGLLATLVRPAIDEAMLKVVPPDAFFLAAGRLDLARTYEQLKSSVIAVAGDDGRKTFAEVEAAAAAAEVPLNAILGPLGEQWILYEAPSTGGFFFTGVTLIVDVKDPQQLARTLGVLKKLIIAQFQPDERPVAGSYEVDGVTIQYIDVTHSLSFISPAWAVVDRKLVIALYPQVVEDAIRQFKAGRSILDNAEFTDVRRRIIGAGSDGPLFYLSGSEFVRSIYPLALPFLTAARESFLEEGEDVLGRVPSPELIPPLGRLLQYVGTDGVCVTLTTDGVMRTKSVANPLLSPLTLTDSIPLWVVAALPTMATSRASADRTRSAANLRQIGQAVQLYVAENNGKLPATLRDANVEPAVLRSPFAADAAAPAGQEKPAADDYAYLTGGLKGPVPPEVVMAYDAAELTRNDGANVLYGDGHVEWLERDGVNKALEKATKWKQDQKKQ
jgi:prepilin-type processing-associated H-X9-DG protein